MPPEIADSDAESDAGSPRAPAYSPILENADQGYNPFTDPIEGIEFSQYLSPTQRLSSINEQQENAAPPPSTGSTDRFLKEIDELNNDPLASTKSVTDTSMANSTNGSAKKRQKRRFSEIENGTERMAVDELQRGNGKRSKTYGSTRSQMSDSASPLFSEDISHASKKGAINAENARPVFVSNSDYGPRGPTSFSNNGLQSGHRSVSTTRSSMGGYQGYEMDFRGAGAGIDIGANPFGSLSQISADGELLPSEVKYLPKNIERDGHLPASSRKDFGTDSSPQNDTLMQMATSPIQSSHDISKTSAKKKKSKVPKHDEPTPVSLDYDQDNYDDVKQFNIDPSTETTFDISESNEIVTVAPEIKKRGRKSKNVQTLAKAAAAAEHDVDDFANDPDMPPKEQYKPRPSRSRASTVDSTTHASDGEIEALNQRQRVKKSSGDARNTEPSSELHLNDPDVIGAPAEVYKPRPSKSRARRIIEDETDQDFEQVNPLVAAQQQALLDAIKAQSEASKPKKKTTKKGRTKQGKPATAVIDQGQEDVNEDKKEVISLNSSLPKSGLVGENHEIAQDNKSDIVASDEPRAETLVNKNITINLPPAPKPVEETEPSKPEPKKRGRKPKKKVEVQAEPEAESEPQVEIEPLKEPTPTPSDSEVRQRLPLVEKDTNTSNTPTLTPSSSTSTKNPLTKTETETGTETPPPQSITVTSTTTTTKQPKSSLISSSSSTPLSALITKPRPVGLSRRTFIPPLLRKLDRTKEPPKLHEKKEKLSKKQKELEEKRLLENEIDGLDADDGARWKERGADGMLVEWND